LILHGSHYLVFFIGNTIIFPYAQENCMIRNLNVLFNKDDFKLPGCFPRLNWQRHLRIDHIRTPAYLYLHSSVWWGVSQWQGDQQFTFGHHGHGHVHGVKHLSLKTSGWICERGVGCSSSALPFLLAVPDFLFWLELLVIFPIFFFSLPH